MQQYINVHLRHTDPGYNIQEFTYCDPRIKTNWGNLQEAYTGCDSIGNCTGFISECNGQYDYCTIDSRIAEWTGCANGPILYTKRGRHLISLQQNVSCYRHLKYEGNSFY